MRVRAPPLLLLLAAGAGAALTPRLEIAPGVHMPLVSINTWTEGTRPTSDISEVIASWLGSGYGIDAAYVTSNEQDMARAINKTGVKRGDLFITSKIPTCMGDSTAQMLIQRELRTLRLDYIDLMLVHAPYPDQFCPGTWRAMEKFHSDGKLKSIGVSNFGSRQLAQLLQHAKVPPAVNQVEFNAHNRPGDTEAFCAEHNITIRAWSPLGEAAGARRAVYSDAAVSAIAKAHGVSPAQAALRWVIQRGHALTLLTSGAEPRGLSMDLFGFSLSKSDVSRLDALKQVQVDSVLGGAVVEQLV